MLTLKYNKLNPCTDLVNWMMSYFDRSAFETEALFDIENYSLRDQEIVLEQIKWEIYGLYSQVIFYENFEGLLDHLRNLSKLTSHLNHITLDKKEIMKKDISNFVS